MLNVNALGLPFKPLVCNHPAPVMDGCVLYLDGRYGGNDPATQTWYDLSGMGNDGTLNNFAYAEGSGWTGKGLGFDGVDDYVDCGNDESLDITNATTLSAWIKIPSKKTNDMYILKKTSSFFIRIDRESEGNAISAFVFINSNPEPRVRIVVPEVDTWYHIVATYDASGGAGNLKAYVNGSLSNSVTRTGNIDISTSDLMIGSSFSGIMRDVAIYNRVLSQQEITQNYLATKCIMPLPHVQGAVLDLRGREGTNTPATTVWQDASGHGNHAELKNVAYTAGDGWTGEGLEFDGVDSYIQTADLGTLNNLTLELTMYSPEETVDKNQKVVLWTAGKDTIIVYGNGASNIESDTGAVPVLSKFNLNNITTTITIVYDINAQTAFYYQDGVLKHSATLPNNSSSFNFGKLNIFANWGGSKNKNGVVYGVRIYPKALTDSEVLQNYLATVNRNLFA